MKVHTNNAILLLDPLGAFNTRNPVPLFKLPNRPDHPACFLARPQALFVRHPVEQGETAPTDPRVAAGCQQCVERVYYSCAEGEEGRYCGF